MAGALALGACDSLRSWHERIALDPVPVVICANCPLCLHLRSWLSGFGVFACCFCAVDNAATFVSSTNENFEDRNIGVACTALVFLVSVCLPRRLHWSICAIGAGVSLVALAVLPDWLRGAQSRALSVVFTPSYWGLARD